jgi:hypothetical protein
MARKRHTLGPLIAYHGCDRSVAEAVLGGHTQLKPSANDYDWLGSGVYFWVDSEERGLDWARASAARKSTPIANPCVIGALIYPGLSLNLTDYGAAPTLIEAYRCLEHTFAASGKPLPENTLMKDGLLLRRKLDCAVINMVHRVRAGNGDPAFDTVYGVFEEGGELYPQAGFRSKTHVQIAVRNLDCIVGYFRLSGTLARE